MSAEYWNLAGAGAIFLIVLVGFFWYYKSYSKRQGEREFSDGPQPKPAQVESADVQAPQGGHQSTQQFCYCWNCGEKNLFGLSVCMKCGKKLYHE